MAAVYRNCMVCGKKFKICSTCQRNMPEELQWRRVVCCPQHFSFHLPIIRYARKEISREQAREDLSRAFAAHGNVEFSENVKSIVDEIFSDG